MKNLKHVLGQNCGMNLQNDFRMRINVPSKHTVVFHTVEKQSKAQMLSQRTDRERERWWWSGTTAQFLGRLYPITALNGINPHN